MANENELTEDQKPFVPADTVDSKGTVWPTVGENIRKGVNGELGVVYDRMPDLDAIGMFWSKLLGKKCTARILDVVMKPNTNIISPDSIESETGVVLKQNIAFFYVLKYEIDRSNGERISLANYSHVGIRVREAKTNQSTATLKFLVICT